jgi:hypothetical protein
MDFEEAIEKEKRDYKFSSKEIEDTPKSIFLVTAGAQNSFVTLTWGFYNLEDAEKFRDYLDSRKGASSTQSYISEHYIFNSFDEAVYGKSNNG